MLGCSLEEAFGKQKKKKDNVPLHANTIARSKMNGGQTDLDNRLKNRIDKDIIIQETTNLEESKNTDNEINNHLVSKLNIILDRLNLLENNFNSLKEKNNNTTISPFNKSQPPQSQPPQSQPPQSISNNNKSTPVNSLVNNNSSNNTIKTLLELKNLRNNNSDNSNNSNNIFNNLVNDSLIEGFNNSNISYIGNQFNELLLFGLMGLFILLLFDYIYKLGKKTY
tara:strand:+ start:1702 stop:2373 length:672 start_codon:yes stop_codon:yes gene_type:complete